MALTLRAIAWQCHTDLTLNLTRPVTLLAGGNAAGKTAILDAFEFAFLGTGKLRGITTKSELASRSIQDEERHTRVEVEIAALGLVLSRSMDRSGGQEVTINGTGMTVTRGDAKIREILGIEPERVRACLEAQHVLEGDANRRRSLFFHATGAEATLGELLGPLQEAGLEEKEAKRIAGLVLKEGFAQAQSDAEKQRAKRTGILKGSEAAAPDPVFRPEWVDAEMRLDTLSMKDLQAREREIEQKVSEAERAEGRERGRCEAELATARSSLAGFVSERELLTRRQMELNGAAEVHASVVQRNDEADADVSRMRQEKEGYEKQRYAIERKEIQKPKRCPAIPGEPVCPMTPSKLRAHRSAMADKIAHIEERLTEIGGALATAEARQREVYDELIESAKKRTELHETNERLAELPAKIEDAEALVSACERALENAIEPEGEDLPTLRLRLENVREVIVRKREYESKLESYQAIGERRSVAERERKLWDEVAKLLKPDGLPARLFAARAQELQRYIDELGIEPAIRLTPAATLEAEIGGRWRVWSQCSESWRLRLSIAATHAVARAAGLPFLLVDRFDHLDPIGKSILLGGLRRVAPHYPAGVLVLATLQRDKPQPTGFSDVETMILESEGVRSIG